MNREREQEITDYFVGLNPEERDGAFERVNARLKLEAPIDQVDPGPPIVTLGEYLDTEIEVPPLLVSRGQLVRGEITVMVGRAGKGKTTLVKNRMIRWAAGEPLFKDLDDSQTPVQPLKTLLIENEGAAWFMQRSLSKLLSASKFDGGTKTLVRKNLLIWGDGAYSNLKVDKAADLELIRRGLGEHQPDVLILEPFRGIWSGEENDATAMEAVLDSLVQLGHEFGCGILLSHHERKTGAGEDGEWMSAARGSAVLEAKSAVMENFRQVKIEGGDYRELSWSKSRYFPPKPAIRMEYDEETDQLLLVPESEITRGIADLFLADPTGWFSKADIADETGETQTKVAKSLDELLDKRDIVKKRHENGYRFRARTPEEGDRGGLSIT